MKRKNVLVWFKEGRDFLKLGKYEEAIEYFDEVLRFREDFLMLGIIKGLL